MPAAQDTQAPVIIGAGWSGLACAVELAGLGHCPIVLDAAPHAGGRARGLDWHSGELRARVDNGQHLLLGAYRDTLALLTRVGVRTDQALSQSTFSLAYPDGWQLAAASAPAPLHLVLGLASAQGVRWCDRAALMRWVLEQRLSAWRVASNLSAGDLLARQPEQIVRRLWRPLCLASLNVEPQLASAQIFLNVLAGSLGADAGASDLLVPRPDLSALLPDAAAQWLKVRGAQLRLRTPVLGIQRAGDRWRLQLRDGMLDARHLVLALPPDRAAALLQGVHPTLDSPVTQLLALRYAPIGTVYLRYQGIARLRRPVFALLDDPARARYGQWVFDRGAFDPSLAGVLSVVISGDGPHMDLEHGSLAQAVARQLGAELGLPEPRDHFTIAEKHATLVPAPGLRRPSTRLPAPDLYLAGDAADSPYPSTLEGSVRAGLMAARAIGPKGGRE